MKPRCKIYWYWANGKLYHYVTAAAKLSVTTGETIYWTGVLKKS